MGIDESDGIALGSLLDRRYLAALSERDVRGVAISAGSFFAAAMRCEGKNLITPGQASNLLNALAPYLSKSDKANMMAGARAAQKTRRCL